MTRFTPLNQTAACAQQVAGHMQSGGLRECPAGGWTHAVWWQQGGWDCEQQTGSTVYWLAAICVQPPCFVRDVRRFTSYHSMCT
jgi:hypothetical protein